MFFLIISDVCVWLVLYHTYRQDVIALIFYEHTFIVADVFALADVIAMFCVLFPYLRQMF